jgi:hypothetical protein
VHRQKRVVVIIVAVIALTLLHNLKKLYPKRRRLDKKVLLRMVSVKRKKGLVTRKSNRVNFLSFFIVQYLLIDD